MKKMQCEVCGGKEIRKVSDGIFECQNCGTQYSTAEVKNLLIEVTGTVKIDHTEDVENAVKRAEQFLAQGDLSKALEYFNIALDLDPDNGDIADKIASINKRVCICTKQNTFDTFAFSDILGAEICADNQVIDGFGNTLAGGIIAGSVGAIIGAVTSPSALCSYKVIIYTKQISSPKRVITLIDSKMSKDSVDYLNAVNFADSVIATIKAIVHLNTTNK